MLTRQVTPTKVQNDKIVRALKKLSISNPDETLVAKMVSAFVALGINPQAKSSSWLARRLKNHPAGFRVGCSASAGGYARAVPGGGSRASRGGGSRAGNRAPGT